MVTWTVWSVSLWSPSCPLPSCPAALSGQYLCPPTHTLLATLLRAVLSTGERDVDSNLVRAGPRGLEPHDGLPPLAVGTLRVLSEFHRPVGLRVQDPTALVPAGVGPT